MASKGHKSDDDAEYTLLSPRMTAGPKGLGIICQHIYLFTCLT